jgi:glutaredoxin
MNAVNSTVLGGRLRQLQKVLLAVALVLALGLLALDRYAAAVHRPQPGATAVTLYTTEWCPYCARLRADLLASGVAFTEYDVEHSLQGQLGMWALRGRGVPVTVVGEKVIYGYRVDQLALALKGLGHTYLPAPAITGNSR